MSDFSQANAFWRRAAAAVAIIIDHQGRIMNPQLANTLGRKNNQFSSHISIIHWVPATALQVANFAPFFNQWKGSKTERLVASVQQGLCAWGHAKKNGPIPNANRTQPPLWSMLFVTILKGGRVTRIPKIPKGCVIQWPNISLLRNF